jgi:hypothetical protein
VERAERRIHFTERKARKRSIVQQRSVRRARRPRP